jgi:signal transduction histidine kinase
MDLCCGHGSVAVCWSRTIVTSYREHPSNLCPWHSSMSAQFSKKLLPLGAFLLFCSMTLAIWQNQNNHESQMVLRHLETSAVQLKLRIEGLLSARHASLNLIADRWVERLPMDFSEQRFASFADILSRHHPGFAGVYWAAPDGVIRWAFPDQDIELVRGRKVIDDPDAPFRLVFGTDTAKLPTLVSPSTELPRGGMGFHIICPLVVADKLQGYLIGAFHVNQIMELCLPQGITENFDVRLYENERLIYSSATDRDPDNTTPNFQEVQQIKFADRVWRAELAPNPGTFQATSMRHPELLFFGLALSSGLALLLYLLMRRVESVRQARDLALQEVNERRRIEATLRDNEKQLENLLGELSAKNVELEAFVYTVSHDLKTPIVTIEGFIGALREDFGRPLGETGAQYLKYMSDAARKMELLINDLLNLSRIGRQVEPRVEFSFREPVEESLEMLRPQIQARGIQTVVQENLPFVYGERKRIGQVLDNLLANAVKYLGPDNPAPCIELGCEEQDGQKVFFVRDNGIGIEERYFGKIFQIFERLPAAKRIGEGTGMGLTIVKRVIEHHGGRVWLTSHPGQGTTFFFTLGDKER